MRQDELNYKWNKELESLITDALRYRYLRRNFEHYNRDEKLHWYLPISFHGGSFQDRLDASIDNAREHTEFNKLF